MLFAHYATQRHRRAALALFALLMMAAQLAGLWCLNVKLTPGGDISYQLLRGIYLDLGTRCEQAPGIVLAERDSGHYVSFHSACGVLADNFSVTPQHEQKLALVEQLMASSVAQLLRDAPYVRNFLVQRADDPAHSGRRVGRTALLMSACVTS